MKSKRPCGQTDRNESKKEFAMKRWCEKTTFEKILEIISLIAFVIWMAFEFFEKRGMANADLGSCISILVICICQAISLWNVKRALSYVAIVGGLCLATAMILLAL